jgi:predicted RNA binding protein YcfA (HicA-like mRNA interferase family)
MKRRDLIKILTEMGCVFARHGGKHDWYVNPVTKQSQPVPRHNEINELLARAIIKKLKSENNKA